jgi:hypothetical protein
MGPVMAKNRAGPWGVTQEPFQDEQDEEENRPAITRRIRMIDWIRGLQMTIVAPLACVICALIIGVITPHQDVPILVQSTFLIAILSIPITLVVHFKGYVFDPARNLLSYPVYVSRRSISISEIRDANAQTISTKRAAFDAGRVIGESRPQTVRSRSHLVNVSGDFGVRVMRFGARYKRDQFLSILRVVAPQCRITRGYWY